MAVPELVPLLNRFCAIYFKRGNAKKNKKGTPTEIKSDSGINRLLPLAYSKTKITANLDR